LIETPSWRIATPISKGEETISSDAAQWNPGKPFAAPDVLSPCGRAIILTRAA
jgi:hypothetical protein